MCDQYKISHTALATVQIVITSKEKMKLAIAVLAAVAESKPKRPPNFKHKPKLNPDNDERWIQHFQSDHGHIKHLYKVLANECSADSIIQL